MASVAHEEAAPKERTQEALKGDVSSVELTSDSNHSVGDSRGVRRAKSSVAALGGAFRAGLSLSMHKRTIGDDEVSVTDRSLTRGVARAKSSTAAIGSLFSSLGRSMQRGRPTAETDMYKMHQSNGDLGLDDLDLQL